ncbi:MAG TPA: ABC transporter ATP-binding protein [Bacteroidia bacterium]|nr:ABC transporter ATP-binding protein [Bacteroidia bacterium]
MIAVQNLKKTFGTHVALNGISFSIKEGEFYGLLGPNGAGKTTTISIISTILQPDEGSVSIGNYDLKRDPGSCKRIIGVVPQEIALYEKLTAHENLVFWGSLYGGEKSRLMKRIDEILHLFGLYERRNDKISTYSGGMKRRINIASALLHNPQILFMDEPTVGIDPQSRNLIFEVVEKLHSDGMTIIYTTHYMEEAERFCDRIGIIDKGEIIAQGTLQELRDQSGMKEVIVVRFASLDEEKEKMLRVKLPGEYTIANATLSYPSDNVKSDLPKIVILCGDLGLELSGIDIQKVNLETIFLRLTGKQLRD